MPELPTVMEAGFPGYRFDSWFGLLAPAGTPKAEVEKINAAVAKALKDRKEFKDQLAHKVQKEILELMEQLVHKDLKALSV